MYKNQKEGGGRLAGKQGTGRWPRSIPLPEAQKPRDRGGVFPTGDYAC